MRLLTCSCVLGFERQEEEKGGMKLGGKTMVCHSCTKTFARITLPGTRTDLPDTCKKTPENLAGRLVDSRRLVASFCERDLAQSCAGRSSTSPGIATVAATLWAISTLLFRGSGFSLLGSLNIAEVEEATWPARGVSLALFSFPGLAGPSALVFVAAQHGVGSPGFPWLLRW